MEAKAVKNASSLLHFSGQRELESGLLYWNSKPAYPSGIHIFDAFSLSFDLNHGLINPFENMQIFRL